MVYTTKIREKIGPHVLWHALTHMGPWAPGLTQPLGKAGRLRLFAGEMGEICHGMTQQ